MVASVTSATTRPRRSAWADTPPVERPPSLSDTNRLPARARQAGARPKRRPVTTATAAVKATARPSSATSAARGTACGLAARSAFRPAQARPSPSAAPASAEHHALGEELAHQPPALGAEAGAHRDLPPPPLGAGEHQVGDVGAGDEQHEADGAEQEQQRRARVAHHLLVQREEDHRVRLWVRVVGVREGLLPAGQQGRHAVARRGERLAGGEPADDVRGSDRRGRRVGRVELQRHPHLDAGVGDVEAGRRDADHPAASCRRRSPSCRRGPDRRRRRAATGRGRGPPPARCPAGPPRRSATGRARPARRGW